MSYIQIGIHSCLYRDRSNGQKYIPRTYKLTGNLLLNTITNINYTQSVLTQRKIQQSTVTNKTTKRLRQYRN